MSRVVGVKVIQWENIIKGLAAPSLHLESFPHSVWNHTAGKGRAASQEGGGANNTKKNLLK